VNFDAMPSSWAGTQHHFHGSDAKWHRRAMTCGKAHDYSRPGQEQMQDTSNSFPGIERLDAWLWAARFFKTRALAKEAIENGRVEVGGQRAKPARQVRIGDRLAITRGEEIFRVEVASLSCKRGSATVAATLYREDPAARALRELERAQRAAERNGYRSPEHKPDKRARRLIQALGDLDAL
jgi:ribosome-associated heat shock protein Hsp15